MVLHGLLPKPLPADVLVVGQLLTHPLHPERDSFYPDKAHAEIDDLNDYHIQLRYKDLFSVDTEGRFMTNYGAKFDLGRIYRQPNLLTVKAEQMIQRTSQHPSQAFQAVCNDPEARTWIYEQVKAGKPLYIVLGLTELKNAVFKRGKLRDAGASNRLNETPIEKDAKVPQSLRGRSDSTLGGLGTEPHISGVFGMDVRRVVARVTTPAEPHSLDDIGYRWSYYDVPNSTNKEQLMIGLGAELKANDLRLMLDLSEEDVQGNLDAISQLSLDALSAGASPMLLPSSPALRGRSPSPNPAMLRHLS
ncbi:Nn.00g082610.m01.CDS01 [Neocucurbitaria sp. VM-36]